MRIRLELIGKIGLSAEEWEEYKVTPGPDGIGLDWRDDLPQEKDIELTPAEHVLLSESLTRLEAAGELRVEQLSLYDKFTENGQKRNKP